jgi:biotin carboxyl carrier protein
LPAHPNSPAGDEPPKARCRRPRAGLPLVACLLASATLSIVAAEPAAGQGEIRFQGDVVSVFALASPVDEILRSIGPWGRFTVSERCGPAGCAAVSGSHRGTLSEIMSWVLSQQNHLILYRDVESTGASTEIARVVLLPPGGGAAIPAVRAGIAPSQVAPIATAQEWRVLRRLRAARLAPPSRRQTSGPGFATLPGERTLAHSAEQGLERPASPASAYRIASDFGWRRDPFDGQAKHHDGVDVVAPNGTPVKSSLAGTVVFGGRAGRYGAMVEIEHGGETRVRYAHLRQVLVEVGERVRPGQTIGLVGDTGRSTGPHLHLEVRVRGQPQDPLSMVGVWPDLGPPITGPPMSGRPETGG